MIRQAIEIEGKRFVLLEERELLQLERRADRTTKDVDLPSLPRADRKGNRPALAFIRASIARDIIHERTALGLSQKELAQLAGVRQATLARIESAQHSPTVRTVQKIETALKKSVRQHSHNRHR